MAKAPTSCNKKVDLNKQYLRADTSNALHIKSVATPAIEGGQKDILLRRANIKNRQSILDCSARYYSRVY